VANVRDVGNVERLLFVIAARSGGLASFHGMASDLGVDTNTVRAHTRILEDLFLVRQLRPWHVNLGSRQIKSRPPKSRRRGQPCGRGGRERTRGTTWIPARLPENDEGPALQALSSIAGAGFEPATFGL